MNAPRQGQHLTGFLPKETNWPGKKLPGHFFVRMNYCFFQLVARINREALPQHCRGMTANCSCIFRRIN